MSKVARIIGIDLGNYNINTSEGVSFPATTKLGHTVANSKIDIQVIYKGKKWTIGAPEGARNIGSKKYEKEQFKVSLLTAIVKSVSDNKSFINTNVVLGVPIETFNNKEIVNKIKTIVKSYGQEKITVGEKEYTVKINDCEIWCESGVVFLNQSRFAKQRTLVFDIGGGTFDVSLWEGLRLKEYKSYKKGVITLHENIAKHVSEEEKCNVSCEYARQMIGKSKFTIGQRLKNISYIDDDIDNYILSLASSVNQYFDIEMCDSIQLVGGGPIELEKWLLDEFEKAELFPESDFANAKAAKKVGQMIWKS